MNNTKDLITEAKKFYVKKNFFEAKSCLLQVFKNSQLDKALRTKLYILISDVCYKINEFKNAEVYLLKYLEEDKSNSNIFNLLGNIYLKKRDYKNSEKFYLKSVKLSENESVLVNLALLYHNLGKREKAISFYKKILIKNPKNIGALYNLSNLDKSAIDEKKIKVVKSIIKKKKIDNFNTASGYFILAEHQKQRKNFNKEINLLSFGNNFSFKNNANKNIQSNKYWFEVISNKFNKIQYEIDKYNLSEVNNIHPIFIIGLPRCGSTLIESIISSGKEKVENLGETNLINWAFLNTNKEILQPSNDKEKIIINFDQTAKKLIDAINNLIFTQKNKKILFSEKSLENFHYIELILNIYPNAKFINPHRNILDNIFAIYKQFLPNLSWSHSIENILLYINNYLLTMKYFNKKYPEKIFSVSLESFTDNPESSAKDIYKFCNLQWDKKCLDFHKRDDLFTNTASINQIRNSVQKYDTRKYEPYKKMLNKYLNKYSWLNSN